MYVVAGLANFGAFTIFDFRQRVPAGRTRFRSRRASSWIS
jgi:hypothetical protein